MVWFWLLGRWVELQKCFVHEFVYLHHSCFVATAVAIIRCRENCYYVFIMRPVVAIHDKLMCSRHKLEPISLVELLCNILSEWVASTSWWNAPTEPVIRIWPEKITDWTFVRHFLNPVELFNLVKAFNTRREPTMQTENLFLHNSCQRQVIKELSKALPHIWISVFSEAFVVEPINLCDLSWLVVSSQYCDSLGIPQLKSDEESHCLNRVMPSVNVVTHKQIVGVWQLAT